MRKLEDALLASGLTAEDLTAMAPMLSNQKYRTALQAQIDNADTLTEQNRKLNGDLDTYTKWWETEIVPDHTKTLKALEDSRADVAAANARVKFLQERGMQMQGNQQSPEMMAEADRLAREASEAVRNTQNQPKFVDAETFQRAFESTGEAIAAAADLAEEHRDLYGSRLNMSELRKSALTNKRSIRQQWETQYNVPAKRAEVAAKAQADHDEKIRTEVRQQMAMEGGNSSNPNLRLGSTSSNPFTVKKQEENGKQPWEVPPAVLRQKRVEEAFSSAVKRGEIN